MIVSVPSQPPIIIGENDHVPETVRANDPAIVDDRRRYCWHPAERTSPGRRRTGAGYCMRARGVQREWIWRVCVRPHCEELLVTLACLSRRTERLLRTAQPVIQRRKIPHGRQVVEEHVGRFAAAFEAQLQFASTPPQSDPPRHRPSPRRSLPGQESCRCLAARSASMPSDKRSCCRATAPRMIPA